MVFHDFFSHFQMLHVYLLITVIITLVALSCLFSTLFKLQKKKRKLLEQDIQAIAGDNVITTQLDLARAYIEMNQQDLARDLLNQIIKKGDILQQSEARQLVATLDS